MQKTVWEYLMVEGFLSQEGLNKLGALGWELVSVDSGWQCFVFKRPKS